jgi:hypothetical protein
MCTAIETLVLHCIVVSMSQVNLSANPARSPHKWPEVGVSRREITIKASHSYRSWRVDARARRAAEE